MTASEINDSSKSDPKSPPHQPSSALGLYLHVPFCATTCNFCAFVQDKPNREKISEYLNSIACEWAHYTDTLAGQKVDTIFWGGGTPGLLLPNDLQELGETLRNHDLIDLTNVKEWTIEMAPATVTPSKLEVLKTLGITRISMGVQTFSDETLKIMDRFHSVKQVLRAWEWIQNCGFQSANVDMIIAFPGQTKSQLLEDLKRAVELNPDHISTYCLTFEEDTPLYAKLMQGVYKQDLDNEADLYREAWSFLNDQGYQQYEISNFAKPNHQSIHNLNTWSMQEWIGLGPSASSQIQNKRWTNSYNTDSWVAGIQSGQFAFEEQINLNDEMLMVDSLIFGLRMNQGVNLKQLQNRFPNQNVERWNPLFEKLQREALAIWDPNNIRLTLEGRLLADAIAVEILDTDTEDS